MYQWPVPHNSKPVELHNSCSHEPPWVFDLHHMHTPTPPLPQEICFGDFFFLNIAPLQAFEPKFSRLMMRPVSCSEREEEVAIHRKCKNHQFFFNLEKEIIVFFWLQRRRRWYKGWLPCYSKLKFILFQKNLVLLWVSWWEYTCSQAIVL